MPIVYTDVFIARSPIQKAPACESNISNVFQIEDDTQPIEADLILTKPRRQAARQRIDSKSTPVTLKSTYQVHQINRTISSKTA